MMNEWFFSEEEYKRAQYLKTPEGKYETANALYNNATDVEQIKKAKEIFLSINYYGDAEAKAEECSKAIKEIEDEETYSQASSLIQNHKSIGDLQYAGELLDSIIDYKDSRALREICLDKIDTARKESLYQGALKSVKSNNIISVRNALQTFSMLEDYKDSQELFKQLTNHLEELEEMEENKKRIAETNRQIVLKRKRKKRIITAIVIMTVFTIIILIWALQPGCMIHSYQPATCTDPQICAVCKATKGEALKHNWQQATCHAPKTCSRCGLTYGEPLQHIWLAATCELPQTCKICGGTKGTELGHEWSDETIDNPKICKLCGKMEPKATPANGTIIIHSRKECPCELTINNQSSNCYVKLKDYLGNDVFSFFVSSSQTASVDVPTGNYYIYFAYGDEWYGKNYLFGENTQCSMDDELQSFTYTNDGYTFSATHLEYTLYKVSNGNFTPKEIDMSEF